MIYPEKINILIVNDNPSSLMAMEDILSELDENIVTVASGEEALRSLLKMDFAVIILYVCMPGMDGFETAKMIHQRSQTKHIPIIFVTAYAQTELDCQKGYELGAVDYLFTPIIPDILKAKVRVFVDLFRTTKTVKQQSIKLTEVNKKLYEAHQEMSTICEELRVITSKLTSTVETQSQQFRDIEQIYRGIFENISEGIFQITPDGSIILANPAFINMLGYDSYEEFTAAVSNIFQQFFVDPDDGEEFRQRINTVDIVHDFEASVYTKDKDVIWVSLSANAVHGKDSHIHYEAIMLNIAHRKELERILINAKKAEAVAELAAETAHEIRNPLQVIQSGLYLLNKIITNEDEQVTMTINQMNNALHRANKFIDELIDSSRMPELNVIHVDINRLLQDVVNDIGIPASITVDWEIDSSLSNIHADSERLSEVLINLVKNAIESMEEVKSGNLKVKSEKEGEFIKITISDTGKGMSEAELANIWTPFYSTKALGKGLGMSIIKRLIEAHKGRIDVESKVGEGTRVVVRLGK